MLLSEKTEYVLGLAEFFNHEWIFLLRLRDYMFCEEFGFFWDNKEINFSPSFKKAKIFSKTLFDWRLHGFSSEWRLIDAKSSLF